jgi:formiminotetrahydrofolate cyclodeaminase
VRGDTRAKAQVCDAQVQGVSLDDQLERTFTVAGTSFLRGLSDQWDKRKKQQYSLVDLDDTPNFESDIFLRKELVSYIQAHGGVTQESGARLDGRLRIVESCNAPVSTQTIKQFINEVSSQNHAMAGAVTAISAAQALALGQACLHITKDIDKETEIDADARSKEIAAIKNELLQWCQQDADAIAEFAALRDAGKEQTGKRLLCEAPAAVCRITVQAAEILQDFRPAVHERVRDDMEMSITLLAGAAKSAMLLLDSNLRIWPEKELLDEFEPILAELLAKMEALSPVERLRE